MMKAIIDYGSGSTFGAAHLWGDFNKETVESFFIKHANQCFGIRKSIMGFKLVLIGEAELPKPWSNFPNAAVVLKHSGDTIVWDIEGNKIKSEFD